MRALKKHILTFSICLCAIEAQAGGGASGGALEITQHANNVELIATVSNTAETINSVNKQVNESIKMVKDNATNLTSLPKEFEWIKDIASTASETFQLFSTLQRAQREFGSAHGWLERRVKSYECSRNERIDSCLRKVSRNVERTRARSNNDVEYFQRSIENASQSVSSLQKMAQRGQEGSGGNKEQFNIMQQQLAAIGSLLESVNGNIASIATSKSEKDLAQINSATTQADAIEKYRAKIDAVNELRQKLGMSLLDTSTDSVYSTDVDAIRNALTKDASEVSE